MTDRPAPNSPPCSASTDRSDRLAPHAESSTRLRGARRLQIDGVGKEHMELARNRTLVAAGLFSLGLLLLGVRLFDLGFLEHVAETNVNRGNRGAVLAARADIVDRNGVVLATNLTTASLYADQKRVLDPEEAADKLMSVLPGFNRAALVNRLTGDGRFVWIRRNLTPEEQWRINNLGIPGLGFEAEDRRVYPHGRTAAHILGFVDIDGKGLAGVERYFNERLSDPAATDQPLTLAMDLRVQHVMREELEQAMLNFSAVGAAGIVLDVNSGEVVSLVSLPDFDPNDPGSANTETMFNRVVQGVYELGSGLKTFTVAMGLDTGTAKLTSSYDATKPLKVARFTINDDHPKARWLSLPEVFMYSSNIGTVRLAMEMGIETQKRYLGNLGLLEKPSIELREVALPLVPNPWREINMMTIAFGHGLAISPLQMSTGIAATINGGRLLPASLIRQDDRSRDISVKQVLAPETSEIMRRLLRLVVVSGTGSKADVPGFEVGGKTGTAEKATAGGYNRRALISSFVGAFPMDDPRYVVMAIIDEPKGTKETYGFASGGWTAAPVVGNVVKRIAPMLGVAPRPIQTKERLQHALLMPVADIDKSGD